MILSPRKSTSAYKSLLEAANDNNIQDPLIATRIWVFVDPTENDGQIARILGEDQQQEEHDVRGFLGISRSVIDMSFRYRVQWDTPQDDDTWEPIEKFSSDMLEYIEVLHMKALQFCRECVCDGTGNGLHYNWISWLSDQIVQPRLLSPSPVTSPTGKKDKHEVRQSSTQTEKLLCYDVGTQAWKVFTKIPKTRKDAKLMNESIFDAFQCHLCGAKFGKRGILMKHVDLKHTKQTPEKCPKCCKMFSSKDSLNSHRRKNICRRKAKNKNTCISTT
ncbi:unnamed protein product [Allacma fusca]|uniref:C2H2-type domain-containing protein n=1 Tax=Allacma fusca TaxID=39272 RepID=A0A8J2KTE1_9HEXA|nr:unnamed protein product [Allacma fusca]